MIGDKETYKQVVEKIEQQNKKVRRVKNYTQSVNSFDSQSDLKRHDESQSELNFVFSNEPPAQFDVNLLANIDSVQNTTGQIPSMNRTFGTTSRFTNQTERI